MPCTPQEQGHDVLAVDDSLTSRTMITLALEQAGMHLQVARDGVHGLEALAGMTPDAIITDINMPRMDGFSFIQQVRAQEKYATVPILVLTTESAQEMKMRARAAGATGLIVKPFDPAKLVGALRMVTGV
jgi:two-component system chemotaxis response regulator CheY